MFSRLRVALVVSIGIALAVGWWIEGSLAYEIAIGLDASAFLGGAALQRAAEWIAPGLASIGAGIGLFSVIALAVGAATFLLVRAVRRAQLGATDPSRRDFLTGFGIGSAAALAASALAAGLGFARAWLGLGRGGRGWQPVFSEIFGESHGETHPEWKAAWKGSRVRAHRRLGRTEWSVSDIALGTGAIEGEKGEQIGRLAIERGVNYFDTSPDYAGAGSEAAMGRAMRGGRDRLFVATKFCTPTGHLPAGAPVSSYVAAVEGSLARLGTDYVDLCHVHACDSVERLLDENLHEAFDRLKQAGKVRFLGFSTHTPNLVEVVETAIESGRFDVMMVAYHHGLWSELPRLIERARRERDMGVVAMKTLKGAKHHGLAGFREHADAYSQAALRWALSNPNVSSAVISFYELQHVDEYLAASGGQLGASDVALLERYDQQIFGSYCAPHCGACLNRCPEQLAIHDVLRYRMYAEDYGWPREAKRLYAQLAPNASACASCSAPCLGSCPVGVPIAERTREAHRMLARAVPLSIE
ncbi:MAG TPA: aldo/keto reductase [Myxococcota bacterium]|nr:aldo/keto reductase [Myxococcota bacterium]